MTHLFAVSLTLWLASPNPETTSNATSLPASGQASDTARGQASDTARGQASDTARGQASDTARAAALSAPGKERRPPDMSWPSRYSRTTCPVTPSRGLPRDLTSLPAWERFYRGKRLYGIGQGLTAAGGVLLGVFLVATPLAVIIDMSGKNAERLPAICVGFGVPIVVLFYSGISLLVKGARLRRQAALAIFGPPDPERPSVRVELGPGGFGLVGRF